MGCFILAGLSAGDDDDPVVKKQRQKAVEAQKLKVCNFVASFIHQTGWLDVMEVLFKVGNPSVFVETTDFCRFAQRATK